MSIAVWNCASAADRLLFAAIVDSMRTAVRRSTLIIWSTSAFESMPLERPVMLLSDSAMRDSCGPGGTARGAGGARASCAGGPAPPPVRTTEPPDATRSGQREALPGDDVDHQAGQPGSAAEQLEDALRPLV